MTLKYLTDANITDNIVILADIHINSSLSEEFESNRLERLARVLPATNTIFLAGDTFDRNSPSLQDLRIFYQFIQSISEGTKVYIINGNHDATTFSFLPEVGFTFISQPTILNDKIMLVPWTQLAVLENHLSTNMYLDKLLISHARCTIPPHITEEISMKTLSDSFKQIVLGDIHTQPTLPYKNILYTTSPSSVSFTPLKRNKHGYCVIDLETLTPKFIPINIPTKYLINTDNFEDAMKEIKSSRRGIDTWFRKIRFRGTAEEIRELSKISPKLTIKDLSLSLEEVDQTKPEESDRLAEFLSSKISLSTFAFNYFKDTLEISEKVLEEIRQSYEQYRTAKGAHR